MSADYWSEGKFSVEVEGFAEILAAILIRCRVHGTRRRICAGTDRRLIMVFCGVEFDLRERLGVIPLKYVAAVDPTMCMIRVGMDSR